MSELLQAYQAALLEALHDETRDPAETIVAIEAAAEVLGEELGPLDEALVDVAGDLTRQWGRLKPRDPGDSQAQHDS